MSHKYAVLCGGLCVSLIVASAVPVAALDGSDIRRIRENAAEARKRLDAYCDALGSNQVNAVTTLLEKGRDARGKDDYRSKNELLRRSVDTYPVVLRWFDRNEFASGTMYLIANLHWQDATNYIGDALCILAERALEWQDTRPKDAEVAFRELGFFGTRLRRAQIATNAANGEYLRLAREITVAYANRKGLSLKQYSVMLRAVDGLGCTDRMDSEIVKKVIEYQQAIQRGEGIIDSVD